MTVNEKKASVNCMRCGREIKGNQTYCAQCVVIMAEESIKEPEKQEGKDSINRKRRNQRRWLIRGVIVAASLSVMLLQAPRIAKALQETPPIRKGVVDTDRVTDQCIRNLWRISSILQEGGTVPGSLKCPACDRPYDVIRVAGKVLVRCPDPGSHGLRELRVSSDSPCPEVY